MKNQIYTIINQMSKSELRTSAKIEKIQLLLLCFNNVRTITDIFQHKNKMCDAERQNEEILMNTEIDIELRVRLHENDVLKTDTFFL